MYASAASRRSPVRVVITPVGTPDSRPGSGRRYSAARSRSVELYEKTTDQLGIERGRGLRQASSSRPQSARFTETSLLSVPGSSSSCENVNNRYSRKGNNSNNSESRSRSASPFGIERENLPTGSPTFQKVLYDILAETEIDKQCHDDLKTPQVKTTIKPTNVKKNPSSKTTRRRPSLSPSVHIRKTLFT